MARTMSPMPRASRAHGARCRAARRALPGRSFFGDFLGAGLRAGFRDACFLAMSNSPSGAALPFRGDLDCFENPTLP